MPLFSGKIRMGHRYSFLYAFVLLGTVFGAGVPSEGKSRSTNELLGDLKSPELAKQAEAKKELHTFHFKEIAKAMKKFANDPNPDIRILMSQTLGELGGFEAARSLKSLFRKEKDDKVRRAILIQLAGLLPDEKEALVFFKKVVFSDRNDDIRYLALTQLSLLGRSPELKKDLLKICHAVWKKDSFRQNKIFAAVILKELGSGDEELWDDAFEALQNSSVEMRRRAALLLGPFLRGAPENSQSFNRVLIATRDSDSEVRANVCRSLGESQKNSSIPILKSLFMDREPLVRKSALDALAAFSEKDVSLDVFTDALKDTDPLIRSFAVEALENFGNASVIPSLEKVALKDTDPQIKYLAKKAIAALSSKKQ